MVELSIAQRWLFAKLNAHSTLTGKVRSGSVYPEDGVSTEPIVTFSFIPEGGDIQLNRVVGGRVSLVRLTFEVKVQAKTSTYKNVVPYSSAIEEVLGRVENEELDGYNINCLRRGVTQSKYFLINEQFREMGGTYMIFLSKVTVI